MRKGFTLVELALLVSLLLIVVGGAFAGCAAVMDRDRPVQYQQPMFIESDDDDDDRGYYQRRTYGDDD